MPEETDSIVRYPVFRFTNWVDSARELESWLDHFERLNRNAGILMFDGRFSVWVQGKEYVGPVDIPNAEAPRGIPVSWVGEFLAFYPIPRR